MPPSGRGRGKKNQYRRSVARSDEAAEILFQRRVARLFASPAFKYMSLIYPLHKKDCVAGIQVQQQGEDGPPPFLIAHSEPFRLQLCRAQDPANPPRMIRSFVEAFERTEQAGRPGASSIPAWVDTGIDLLDNIDGCGPEVLRAVEGGVFGEDAARALVLGVKIEEDGSEEGGEAVEAGASTEPDTSVITIPDTPSPKQKLLEAGVGGTAAKENVKLDLATRLAKRLLVDKKSLTAKIETSASEARQEKFLEAEKCERHAKKTAQGLVEALVNTEAELLRLADLKERILAAGSPSSPKVARRVRLALRSSQELP